MKRAGTSSRRHRLPLVIFRAALAVAWAAAAAAAAQTPRGGPPPELKPGERLIEVAPLVPRAEEEAGGLSVTEIRVGGEKVALGRPFAAGADWLRTLTVRVRNDSEKPITYVQLHFNLPETRYPGGEVGFMFHYNVLRLGGVDEGAPQLMPGKEADLGFIGDEYGWTLKLVERMSGLTDFNFTRLHIRHAHLVFADGTRGRATRPARGAQLATTGGAK
jgi:hypothetical protein